MALLVLPLNQFVGVRYGLEDTLKVGRHLHFLGSSGSELTEQSRQEKNTKAGRLVALSGSANISRKQ